MSIILGVDIDGILSNFNEAYMSLMVKVGGRDLFEPKPFNIFTWHYPEAIGYSDPEVKEAWKSITANIGFWSGLRPYEGVAEFLQKIKAEPNLYFITSRVGVTAKRQTELWLSRQCHGLHPTILISSHKALCCKALGITHYIDDNIENCEDVRDNAPDTKCYMMERTWNKPVDEVPIVKSLQEFLEIVRG